MGIVEILIVIAGILAVAALFRSEGPLTAVAVLVLAVALLAGRI